MMAALIRTCLTKPVEIGAYLLLYLGLETVAFSAILAASVAFTHWITRAFLYVNNLDKERSPVLNELVDTVQTVLVCWFIGIITLKWMRSWKVLMTPKWLQQFQEVAHPLFHAWIRTIFGFALLIACTCIQTCSFFEKFNKTATEVRRWAYYGEKIDKNEHAKYMNDLKFTGAMYLLVYLSVRIFKFYGNINGNRVDIEAGEVVRRPEWQVYLEHYYTLFGYELFLADFVLLLVLGIGVILQDDSKINSCWSYFLSCVICTGLGILLGDVEERLPWLDNRMERKYPSYRNTHWDVRLHFLTFLLLPLQAILFIRPAPTVDIEQIFKAELLHNLLHMAFTGTFWFVIAKGNALTAYVIRGHYWHEGGEGPIEEGHHRRRWNRRDAAAVRRIIQGRNRVFPQIGSSGDPVGESGGGSGSGGGLDANANGVEGQNPENTKMTLRGVSTALKNMLRGYFPVNGATQNDVTAAVDQGSVSTGTCSSLLNRPNVNESCSGGVVVAEVSVSRSILETSTKPEEENGASSKDIGRDCEKGSAEELHAPRDDEDANNNEGESEVNVVGRTTEVTFSTEVEDQAPIRLKRCPSTVFPVTVNVAAV